ERRIQYGRWFATIAVVLLYFILVGQVPGLIALLTVKWPSIMLPENHLFFSQDEFLIADS
ncbi:hypothetical protein L915_19984, partial [Phytophthora nicotianae]